MDERIGRWSRGKLLPTVVIDCSNDQATAENEQLKAIGWTTIVADPSRKTQGLINCEVFQLEHDTVEPHVVRYIFLLFKEIPRNSCPFFTENLFCCNS